MTEEDCFMSIQTAARLLGVHEVTIRRAIKGGRLSARQMGPGGRYRIRRCDLLGLLAKPSN